MGEAILEMPCKLACRCQFRRIVDCHVFCPNGSDCFARHVGQEQTALDTMLSDYERAALYTRLYTEQNYTPDYTLEGLRDFANLHSDPQQH